MNWEREFFKLAGFMLLSRFQIMHGRECTRIRGHATRENVEHFHGMSCIGYVDSVEEMRLILKERRKK
jgi:hypothetical protein